MTPSDLISCIPDQSSRENGRGGNPLNRAARIIGSPCLGVNERNSTLDTVKPERPNIFSRFADMAHALLSPCMVLQKLFARVKHGLRIDQLLLELEDRP
ncbi:MAG: hypothetical protein LZF86_110927 [Nitrospira sp.]|nr:MAG: hypothetical protein LZF86_110927 [Nitrospira sp.]